MSGNAKGWSLKNEEKHQGWARIDTVLEEEDSRVLSQLVTSPSCAVKSALLTFFFFFFFATGFQVKKRIPQGFPRKQKLMLPQQLQPPLAKFCSGTNRSLPSAVYF